MLPVLELEKTVLSTMAVLLTSLLVWERAVRCRCLEAIAVQSLMNRLKCTNCYNGQSDSFQIFT